MKSDRMDIFIAEALNRKSENIGPLPFTAERIKYIASCKKRKEKTYMKFSKTKKLVVVGVLCLASITCFAAVKFAGTAGHTRIEFYSLENVSDYSKKVGFSPKYVDKFDNGFVFNEGGTGETYGSDGNGGVVGKKYKEMTFSYTNSSGNWVNLNVTNGNPYVDNGEAFEAGYSSQMYKFVPGDYELTEEDKKAKEDGSLEISYGTDEVETMLMESYSWTDGGLYYILSSANNNLGEAAMAGMADKVQNQ